MDRAARLAACRGRCQGSLAACWRAS